MTLLILAGCAPTRPAATPGEVLASLRTGAPLLACRDDSCLSEWRRVQPQALQLDAAARWPELATLIVGTGYQDDLTLYYLGRAAEGTGFPGAAASYYRQSTYISGTSLSCVHRSQVCAGVALPRAALSRIAAIERGLARSRVRRPTPATAGRPEPPAGDAAAAPAVPPVAGYSPLPAGTQPEPTPEPTPPPPPARSDRSAAEYIEPPPAR